jgi:hypothetical protein
MIEERGWFPGIELMALLTLPVKLVAMFVLMAAETLLIQSKIRSIRIFFERT